MLPYDRPAHFEVNGRHFRWRLTLRERDTINRDLYYIGLIVGPRTGKGKGTHGQKEDYVLRRVVAGLALTGDFHFPVRVTANKERPGVPDFTIEGNRRPKMGLEITEAGEEIHQEWLTRSEEARKGSSKTSALESPLDNSTPRTANEIKKAIGRKVQKFDAGSYRSPLSCDLAVYDNTASGGFLDRDELVTVIGRPDDLLGRFERIHLLSGGFLFVDLFGDPKKVNIRQERAADYFGWLSSQYLALATEQSSSLDWPNLSLEVDARRREILNSLSINMGKLVRALLLGEHVPRSRNPENGETIVRARSAIESILAESPSLWEDCDEQLRNTYDDIRREVEARKNLPPEMRTAPEPIDELDAARLPESPPYDVASVLDEGFFPERKPGSSEQSNDS